MDQHSSHVERETHICRKLSALLLPKKLLIADYDFSTFCTNLVIRYPRPGRPEIDHGMLIEKALLSVFQSEKDFPYIVHLNSKIKDISCDAEVGKLYECTVKSILKEGLVIEYNGGRHGLLHIFLSCPLKRYFERKRMCRWIEKKFPFEEIFESPSSSKALDVTVKLMSIPARTLFIRYGVTLITPTNGHIIMPTSSARSSHQQDDRITTMITRTCQSTKHLNASISSMSTHDVYDDVYDHLSLAVSQLMLHPWRLIWTVITLSTQSVHATFQSKKCD
ncbi:hypothetical protein YC2023_050805 [Brassica napus]